jgi:hypothetical protein
MPAKKPVPPKNLVVTKGGVVRSTMSNGNGGLSFGRMVGGAVTLLVVAVTIWSIIWVPLVLASYGVTKLKEAVGDVWGKKK